MEILFFTSFTAQRRELRIIWNELDNDKNVFLDWKEFLFESDAKVLQLSKQIKSININKKLININNYV